MKNSAWQAVRLVPSRGMPHFERLSDTIEVVEGFWRGIKPGSGCGIKVNFYAGLRQAVGAKSIELELPDETRIADLLARVVEKYPAVRGKLLDEQGVYLLTITFLSTDGISSTCRMDPLDPRSR